jgi:hypothetical protein
MTENDIGENNDFDNSKNEIEDFEETKEDQKNDDTIIELNVGGHHITTYLSTLQKEKTSKLSEMFENYKSMEVDKDGNIFLDRPPEHFENILNR